MTRRIEKSMTDIASNAARAAVKATSNSTLLQLTTLSGDNNNTTVMVDKIDLSMNAHTASSTQILSHASISCQTAAVPARPVVLYSSEFDEVPTSYVHQIQSGEFFNLLKLLPKNMSFADQLDDHTILTLENSVIKASPPATSKITDINPWTIAFTIYMSVLFHQFPGRAQEFLAYMSLIRDGAHTHSGLVSAFPTINSGAKLH